MNEHPSMDQVLLDRLYEAIENNLDNEQFGVTELAAESGLSKSQLNRKLQALTGQSASQFIREYRLTKALELLQDNAATASEVAYLVGFRSPSYFSTCFSDVYGYPPSEVKFRKSDDKEERSLFSKKTILISLSAVILIALSYFSYRNIASTSNSLESKLLILDKTIAVLPFRNDSPDHENEYFCRGIEDQIRIQLGEIAGLNIESRQSVEKYRGDTEMDVITIGAELGVAYIVEGSVSKIADDIVFHVTLIDAITGDQLWGETYVGNYSEKLLFFQSKTAKQIASALNVVITPEEEKRIDKLSTSDITAYDFYVNGKYELGLYWFTRNVKHFKAAHSITDKALEIDPNYSNAYTLKASIYFAEGIYDSVLFYVDRALEIDPNNLQANSRKARYYQTNDKPDSAIQYFLNVLEINPNHSGSNLYLGQIYCLQKNDIRKGFPYLKKALELSGEDASMNFNVGVIFINLVEYASAEKYLKKALEIDAGCTRLHLYNWLLLTEGNYNKALHFTDSICPALDCDNTCNEWFIRLYRYQNEFVKAEEYIKKWEAATGERIYNPSIGYVYHKLGRLKEAEEVFAIFIIKYEPIADNILRKGFLWYKLAQIHAFQNRKEKAIQFIEKIVKQKYGLSFIDLIINDPMFENIWDDPDFLKIVIRVQEKKANIRVQIMEMEERGELDL